MVAKPTRAYRSPHRAAQAEATRTQILDAAVELFCARGYAGTTMQAVADRAGVAVESVYGLASKARLLELALERTIVAGSEAPLAQDPVFRAALDASDQRSQLRTFATLAAGRARRGAAISRAFVQAAGQDENLAARWQEQEQRRLRDTRTLVEAVAARGGLRAGLTVETATATVWTTLNWYTAWLLYDGRPEREDADVADWFEATLAALLLP